MLLTVLPVALFSNGWLTVKIGLLVVYIVMGVFAIKRGRTNAVKDACYVAALATFGMVYTIASEPLPLGLLHGLPACNPAAARPRGRPDLDGRTYPWHVRADRSPARETKNSI